jgi:hypothetical protein
MQEEHFQPNQCERMTAFQFLSIMIVIQMEEGKVVRTPESRLRPRLQPMQEEAFQPNQLQRTPRFNLRQSQAGFKRNRGE